MSLQFQRINSCTNGLEKNDAFFVLDFQKSFFHYIDMFQSINFPSNLMMEPRSASFAFLNIRFSLFPFI